MTEETPPPITPSDLPEEPTWEEDENHATAALRSAFVLVSGVFLLWAQWRAPISPAQQWGRWVANSVVSNLILPLGLVWFFLAQGVRYQDWLVNQRHNAWNYGWKFLPPRRHLLFALACWAVLLPFLWHFSGLPEVRSGYVPYLAIPYNPRDWAFLISTLVLYMFCWEWFFRGFLLFGMAQGFGAIAAIVLQAVLFGFTHIGKPPIEMYSAFAGGLVLGIVCWREKSFAPAFYTHALIHVTWTVLLCR